MLERGKSLLTTLTFEVPLSLKGPPVLESPPQDGVGSHMGRAGGRAVAQSMRQIQAVPFPGCVYYGKTA